MDTINTKLSFVELGKFLSQFTLNEQVQRADVLHNDLYFEKFKDIVMLSQSHNGWFTPEQVYFAVQSWAEALTESNLNEWSVQEYNNCVLVKFSFNNEFKDFIKELGGSWMVSKKAWMFPIDGINDIIESVQEKYPKWSFINSLT